MADEALKELRRIRELLEKLAHNTVIDISGSVTVFDDDTDEAIRRLDRHKHVHAVMRHRV